MRRFRSVPQSAARDRRCLPIRRRSLARFAWRCPGESGTRNPLRGDGYYSWDTGLDKTFSIADRVRLQFRWEVFNVTNSVRFDPHSINASMDNAASFGYASSTLTDKRVMQVALRVEF